MHTPHTQKELMSDFTISQLNYIMEGHEMKTSADFDGLF